MAIVEDPEGREISVLRAMIDFRDARVLEVGCGDGRLTWRYADKAAAIVGIDPDEEDIEKAKADTPDKLKERIRFLESEIGEFAASGGERNFDVAIFAWSL
jgi:2-polyprenyl-3-methyl-5-hydroxy-6-metoxy-1,4-benzoquinol methylase